MSWEEILKEEEAGLARSNSAFRAFVKEIEQHIKDIKDLGSKISALDLGDAGQSYAKTIEKNLESLEDWVINSDIKPPSDVIQREGW